ncbi:MAG: hypothetical protein Q8O14_02155 [bacterium]|nr:hypothetical protein [bacterium]
MDMHAPPPGAKSFFRPHNLWWLPDRLFTFGMAEREAKAYHRPGYTMGVAGPALRAVPLSSYERGEPLKGRSKRRKWVLYLPEGSVPGLEGDSLLLVHCWQELSAWEAAWSHPRFIAQASPDIAKQVVDLLKDWIDAHLSPST